MFGKKNRKKNQKNENYDRVYQLHQQAEFIFYVDDAYPETYKGSSYIKLLGIVAKGTALVSDTFFLYDCNGRKKADVTMEELYVAASKVEAVTGGDKPVALYPKEQDVDYKAGDILVKLKEEQSEFGTAVCG